jgi:acetyl-CoA C-acetyltransferase
MSDAFIVSAVRTPIGKYLGGLADLHMPALALGARALAEAIERAKLPDAIDEVIMGCVLQAGLGQNPARQAALLAGVPYHVAALTVNKVCGSGLKAVMLAAQAIRAGDADIVLAGGMESMSWAPHLLFETRTGWKLGDQKAVDSMIHDGLWCMSENWHMGEAAEHIAAKCDIGREEQDRFAIQSQQRAAQAWAQGAFDTEVVSVTIGAGAKARTITQDECFRADTNREGLAKLKPAFRGGRTVTAGNSSTLADGAAAVAVVSTRALDKLGVKPMARVVAYATSGIAPKDIFLAPVGAVRMVLEKARLAIGDIDLFELNEAFAAQMLACNKDLEIDEAKLNVHGGAIALGHPIGASGTRVLVTLLHALERRNLRRGLACLCLGGGNAVAMIVERG